MIVVSSTFFQGYNKQFNICFLYRCFPQSTTRNLQD